MNNQDDRIALTPQGLVARLKTERFAEADGFVTRCPSLHISAQGETEQEAGEALDEAIRMFLTDLVEDGNLDSALVEDLGWQHLPASPDWRRAFAPPSVQTSTVEIGPIAVPA